MHFRSRIIANNSQLEQPLQVSAEEMLAGVSAQSATYRPPRMKAATKWSGLQNRRLRLVSSLFCLLLFVTLQVFASSSPLHRLIHHDADSPNHHCAVTLLAQGQVNSPVVWPGLVSPVDTFIFYLPLLESEGVSSFDYRLSPSRAPPLV
jgi:hypothetical protein